jgi:hypothetical protein
MKPLHRLSSAAALGLAVVFGTAAAQSSVAVESGGVDTHELAVLKTRAHDFSFELTLAAKHSGAYLADVDVVVNRLPDGEVVLEHRTKGPLMLADLPPGRYRLDARYDDVLPGAASHVRRNFEVTSGGLRRMVIYFDTGDTVGR